MTEEGLSSEEKAPKVALVTGSSRGIGLACARKLAANGFAVALNCSSEKSLEATRGEAAAIAQTYGVATCAIAANVAIPEEAQMLVETAVAELGSLDVLVNNAGITRDGLIARMKESDFDDVIAINLKGTFNCCKAASRIMMKQRRGTIINMSSIVGLHGNAGQVNYAASKAGVIGITKSLAKELASRHITVNAIGPGFIATDMTDALSEEQRAAMASQIALGRLGEADDIAAVVAFLASPEACYITGQVITVDGGLTL